MTTAKILDCTLRDGAYLVDKNFGAENIYGIIDGLVKAKIDYIEIGYLQDKGCLLYTSLNPFFEVDGKCIFVYDLQKKAEPEKKERKKQICRLWNYFMKERFLMLDEILPVGREKAVSLIGTVFGKKHS